MINAHIRNKYRLMSNALFWFCVSWNRLARGTGLLISTLLFEYLSIPTYCTIFLVRRLQDGNTAYPASEPSSIPMLPLCMDERNGTRAISGSFRLWLRSSSSWWWRGSPKLSSMTVEMVFAAEGLEAKLRRFNMNRVIMMP